jgi:hypothetical protein
VIYSRAAESAINLLVERRVTGLAAWPSSPELETVFELSMTTFDPEHLDPADRREVNPPIEVESAT